MGLGWAESSRAAEDCVEPAGAAGSERDRHGPREGARQSARRAADPHIRRVVQIAGSNNHVAMLAGWKYVQCGDTLNPRVRIRRPLRLHFGPARPRPVPARWSDGRRRRPGRPQPGARVKALPASPACPACPTAWNKARRACVLRGLRGLRCLRGRAEGLWQARSAWARSAAHGSAADSAAGSAAGHA